MRPFGGEDINSLVRRMWDMLSRRDMHVEWLLESILVRREWNMLLGRPKGGAFIYLHLW